MSTSSTASGGIRRVDNIQRRQRATKHPTSIERAPVDLYDAYKFALGVAYLAHLLQPKKRRRQHTAAPQQQHSSGRNATSVKDLLVDLSHVQNVQTIRLPKGFMAELEKRLGDVVTGRERMPEFADGSVRRTFAVFLNEFMQPPFRKSMEASRKAEDLVLIFYARASTAVPGTDANDERQKLMVDRYVALFVRLFGSMLKGNSEWARDKAELIKRLHTLETKLQQHDQDLSATNGGASGVVVEVEVPRSRQVKDMPQVLMVADIFGKLISTTQSDIDDQKAFWTEKAALQDLKVYQKNLSLSSKFTLRPDDFETNEAYEIWKKKETTELVQMIAVVVQSDPSLRMSPSNGLDYVRTTNGFSITNNELRSPIQRASESDLNLSHSLNSPFDDNPLFFENDALSPTSAERMDEQDPYIFIPPNPRAYYRTVLKEVLAYERQSGENTNPENTSQISTPPFFSKKSSELLAELGMRWRIPLFSQMVLFLDCVRQDYAESKIGLPILDSAFWFVKESLLANGQADVMSGLDRSNWAAADSVLNQLILVEINENLLRDLFEELRGCYDATPSIELLMNVLELHVWNDPLYHRRPEELEIFAQNLQSTLREKAQDKYDALLQNNLIQVGEAAEFFHVLQFSKAVLKLLERIQKRYKRSSEIMGVKPFTILAETVFPAFAADSQAQVRQILSNAQSRNEEIPEEDGFELYQNMADMRQYQRQTLLTQKISFHIEDLFAPFVWRFIAITEEKIIPWVEGAIREDTFKVRAEQPPNEEERHSVSVMDIFSSFNQAIHQISQLNWEDDYHLAKFMTALMKNIAAGLIRYSEQIEQLFMKEMDRLTPEQEAMLTQTRQEKWMRIAKDAFNSRDKATPFQFLPESFVKLNNIEWAMNELDKMEKKINAEKCAEVIKRREPPTAQRQKKPESFVFTIKIIEAEDLKACDANGLSDPYVVLVDEHQKRLAKTRIIYGDLNPRWDEKVDVTTTGPLNIVATIWDWDMMGDHDYEGRASIKLDPSYFRDFHPHEYWLDLDTQGRLLVRVSMEGEKDDIQFHFGKAFRALKRTENDMARKITDKLSAYIQYCISKRTLRSLTTTSVTSAVSSFLQRTRAQQPPPPQGLTTADIEAAIHPLTTYFDENFALMNQTLTDKAMQKVMTRLWKETLGALESLLIPPLSDKPSTQKPLNEQELDIVYKWLEQLYEFFHAEGEGISADALRSPKYVDLKELRWFYTESTKTLINESERRAMAASKRTVDAVGNRLSAPAAMARNSHGFGGSTGFHGGLAKRSKSIMLNRNFRTIRQAKEEARKEAQAEQNDDMILRILRMRTDEEGYLQRRSIDKQKAATNAAAQMMIQRSLARGAAMGLNLRGSNY